MLEEQRFPSILKCLEFGSDNNTIKMILFFQTYKKLIILILIIHHPVYANLPSRK